MKKKITTLLVGTMLVASLTACSSNNAETNTDATATPEVTAEATAEATTEAADVSYTDGTYEGTGTGNNGEIKVSVTVEEGKITEVSLVEHAETDGIYQNAETGVIEAIIAQQTAEVDTVAGATNSSKGIMEAVTNALADAQ